MPPTNCPLCQNEFDTNANPNLLNSSRSSCPTCQNLCSYWDKNNAKQLNCLKFPGPGIILNSPIYGNYVVASRPISEGELIIRERGMLTSPYGLSDLIPYCLGCHKDVALCSQEKCPSCKWSLCKSCQNNKSSPHFSNECGIFSQNKVKPQGVLAEYFAIEVLRALLSKRWKDPYVWERVSAFEGHREGRKNSQKGNANTEFILNFIREKCGLGEEFDEGTVDHVAGVLAVNTFWSFQDLERYSSVLFDKVTLFAHDCDPNTARRMILVEKNGCDKNGLPIPISKEDDENGNKDADIGIEVYASRQIAEGEMINIRYINVDQTLEERRSELQDIFYFNCACSRCISELGEAELEKNMKSVSI